MGEYNSKKNYNSKKKSEPDTKLKQLEDRTTGVCILQYTLGSIVFGNFLILIYNSFFEEIPYL